MISSSESRAGNKVRIVIAGDSTASNYGPDKRPKTGWGMTFRKFFDDNIEIMNHAASGRSSKSFIDEGRMDKALNDLRKGDFMMIQFGHNDEKDDPARHTEPFTTYKEMLSKYIDGARSRGAEPMFLTPVSRRRFDGGGRITPSHGDYPRAMIELAGQSRVSYIDITAKSEDLFNKTGVLETIKWFLWLKPGESPNFPEGLEDNTHFNETGAVVIGKLVIEGLVELKHPLVKYLR